MLSPEQLQSLLASTGHGHTVAATIGKGAALQRLAKAGGGGAMPPGWLQPLGGALTTPRAPSPVKSMRSWGRGVTMGSTDSVPTWGSVTAEQQAEGSTVSFAQLVRFVCMAVHGAVFVWGSVCVGLWETVGDCGRHSVC